VGNNSYNNGIYRGDNTNLTMHLRVYIKSMHRYSLWSYAHLYKKE